MGVDGIGTASGGRSMDIIINYVDGMFAMMAIPTMISTILLAPKVMIAARNYFSRLETKKSN